MIAQNAAWSETDTHVRNAVYGLLHSLFRLLLRMGINYREFTEIAKKAMVDAASEEGRINGKRPSKARVALLTGLTRIDAARLLDATVAEIPKKSSAPARILGRWNSQDRPNLDRHDLEPEGQNWTYSAPG